MEEPKKPMIHKIRDVFYGILILVGFGAALLLVSLGLALIHKHWPDY